MIHDSGPEDEEEPRPTLLRRTTIGNGPPDSVLDWTKEPDIGLSNQNDNNHAYSRKNWRLLRCQNGLRIFEELVEVEYHVCTFFYLYSLYCWTVYETPAIS